MVYGARDIVNTVRVSFPLQDSQGTHSRFVSGAWCPCVTRRTQVHRDVGTELPDQHACLDGMHICGVAHMWGLHNQPSTPPSVCEGLSTALHSLVRPFAALVLSPSIW